MSVTTNENFLLDDARRVITEEAHALSRTANLLDEKFLSAVKILSEAKKIVVCGVGKSGLIGQKIAATFSSTCSPAIFLHPSDALHGDIGIIDEGDVVLMLSKSGGTEELVRIIPLLKRKKIPIVAIVAETRSTLAQAADAILDGSVEREACPLNLAPMSSTTVSLALGDALAAALIHIKNIRPERFAELHPLGQLGKNLNFRVEDVMHDGRRLPKITSQENFRSALLEISEKGLGCVCVIEEENLLGIITDGDVRRALQEHDDIRTLKVEDVMTKNPLVVSPMTLLGEALEIMENRERQIGVLPVVNEEKKCVGVIRIHDIIRSGL